MVSPGAYQPAATGDGPQGAHFKGIDGEYVSLATVAPSKLASWCNLNELELLNSRGGRNMEGTSFSSSACMAFPSATSNIDGTEGHMGAFFPASNIQAEGIQTLHLMNSEYMDASSQTRSFEYMDASSQTRSLVIVNPSVVVRGHEDCSVSNNVEFRQHYVDLSTSPRSFVSHQSTLGHLYNSALGAHTNLAQPSLLLNKFGTNTWAFGNELPFVPISDAARVMQPLAARPACMEPGQQETSISLLMTRHDPVVHDDQGSILQHGSASGLTVDDNQASPRSNQGLSLSLSGHENPLQMQCYEVAGLSNCQVLVEGGAAEGKNRDEGYLQKWLGSSNQWRTPSCGSSYQEAGLQSCNNRKLQVEASTQAVQSLCGFLIGSKYVKAAQLLLEEVASLGYIMKRSSSMQKGTRSLMAGGSSILEQALKSECAAVETMNVGKQGLTAAISFPNIGHSLEQKLAIVEPNSQENQDLQLKKAKLVAMLDEVDRRYKLYFSQMEAIVYTFESAAGLGAAKTYTAFALQTISKHFRGLRDAIGGQIRAASQALGEDDPSPMGLARLRYMDQQWRQQGALQQLGMVQHHAWRPQRGLPERAVSVLRAWLFENFLHPYPKDADKHMLARQTGLTRNQVSNWFINARVRLWKPMVEEMYLEETKEARVDRTVPAETPRDQNNILEASDNHRSGISSMDDHSGAGMLDCSSKRGPRDEVRSKDEGNMGTKEQSGSNLLKHAAALDGGDGIFLKGLGVLSSYGQGFKPVGGERKVDFGGQNERGIATGRMEEHHALGSYPGDVGGFATMPAGYNGVSLTLGLQHSNYLSLAGAQQQQPYQYYLQHEQQQQHQILEQQQQHHILSPGASSGHFSQLAMAGSRRRLNEVDDYYPSIDSTKNYEVLAELQTRKRYAYDTYNHD